LKLKLLTLTLAAAFLALGAVALAGPRHAHAADICPPGTTDPNYCQVNDDVVVDEAGQVKMNKGAKSLDTGEDITCPASRTQPCTGDAVVTAPLKLKPRGKKRDVQIAKEGFSIKPGKTLRLVVAIKKNVRPAILKLKKITVSIEFTIKGKTPALDNTYFREATVKVVR
jgi:hypothetical protein